MLDDLKLINQRDPDDALGTINRQWKELDEKFSIKVKKFKPSNIVFAGMGGSALAGQLSMSWPGYSVPFELLRNYDIPKYVSQETLFIASSYSGNTEEAISALHQAAKQGAYICVLAGGGELVDIAKDKDYPIIVLPKVSEPRYAVLYFLRAIVTILGQLGLLDEESAISDLEKAAVFLESKMEEWSSVVPTAKNLAKQIAIETVGKSVVIYSGPKLAPAAYKWKISFNENPKQVAWWGQYPEFNHNEFIGWSEQPPIKPYCVIDLRSSLEHKQIQKRFIITAKLLSGRRPEPIVVEVQGSNILEQLLYASALGDYTSIYAAILAGVNPVPVGLVEKLKKELV